MPSLFPPPPPPSSSNQNNAIGELVNSFGGAVSEGAQALASVPNNVAENAGEQLDKVKNAFKKGGLAVGTAEVIDQASVGSIAANVLESTGVIPDNAAAMEFTAGVVNTLGANPIAIKDFMEFGQAFSLDVPGLISSHMPPPPKQMLAKQIAFPGFSSTMPVGDGEPANVDLTKERPKVLDLDLTGCVNGILGGSEFKNDPNSFMSKLPPNATFEDLVAAFMMDTMREQQREAMGIMKELQAIDQKKEMLRQAKQATEQMDTMAEIGTSLLPPGPVQAVMKGAKKMTVGQFKQNIDNELESLRDSRQLIFERLKNQMNRIQQMQQALSNVLNTMHQGAMNVIRNIK